MKKIKIFSIVALILSTISMIWGIGVVCYYVDNLFVRGTSVAILVMTSTFISSTVRLIFRELK